MGCLKSNSIILLLLDYFYPKGEEALPAGRWPANFIHDGSEEATDLLGLRLASSTVPRQAKRIGMGGVRNCKSVLLANAWIGLKEVQGWRSERLSNVRN